MSSQSGDAGEYEQFRRTFFEECAEILADLDASFGCLRDEGGDREVLNAIFRAVHSIKAGAGAFGYHILVQFTHNFEAALDGLRGGRIALDPYIPKSWFAPAMFSQVSLKPHSLIAM